MPASALQVSGLTVRFLTREGVIKAVDDVSLSLERGKTLALVGESGSGKSVTALAIMRLVPPPGVIVSGEIWMEGRNLLPLTLDEMRAVRGRDVAMIFQDPMTSLNPVYTVGDQIAEAIELHEGLNRRNAWRKALDMMAKVQIPDPERRARSYPHQLSGGLRQRVMIAMALSCNPKILIADEPTTALDVTIQAEILDLLAHLQRELDLSVLLISHDLGVVAENADIVAVMYAGRVVEQAPVRELFHNPKHPYTEGLLRSIPRLSVRGSRSRRLETIEGTVPKLSRLPDGCAFAPRCKYAIADCRVGVIPAYSISEIHSSRCIRFEVVGRQSSDEARI